MEGRIDGGRSTRLPYGALLVGLLTAIVVSERMDDARRTVRAVREAGEDGSIAPSLEFWIPAVIVGVALASVVAWAGADLISDAAARGRFTLFASGAVGLWTAWQVVVLVSAVADVGVLAGIASPLHTLAVACTALAAWTLIGGRKRELRKTWTFALELLVLLGLYGVFFAVPMTSDQMVDVLRAWGETPWTTAFAGVGGALLLGAVIRATALRALAPAAWAPAGGPWRRRAVVVAAALLAIALIAMEAYLGLVVLGVTLALMFVSAWGDPRQPTQVERDSGSAERVARFFGLGPLAILFCGLIGATLDSMLLASEAWPLLVVTVVVAAGLAGLIHNASAETAHDSSAKHNLTAFVLGALGVVLSGLLPDVVKAIGLVCFLAVAVAAVTRWPGGRDTPGLYAAAGAALGAAFATYVEPVSAPRALGAVGVALLAATGAVLLLRGANAVATRRPLTGLGLGARVPVLPLLALWVIVAIGWPQDRIHQARTVSGTSPTASLSERVEAWLERETAGDQTYVPMVLIAASGGGSKAAYWTALTLDCLLGDKGPSADHDGECAPSGQESARLGRIFLTSSVSGGSVGVYHFVDRRSAIERGETWVEPAAAEEVLSPITAWGLFHDLPVWLMRATTDPRECTPDSELACRRQADRAAVQEAAVAGRPHGVAPSKSERMLDLGDGPLTVFNGSLDGADARVLISPVGLAPLRPPHPGCDTPHSEGEPAVGSLDASDVLDGDRVPLVTAALLSARFPGVAPAARLGDAEDDLRRCSTPEPLPPVWVRDGGYIENTGLLTIVDLLPAIQSAIGGWKPKACGANVSQPAECARRSRIHVQIIVVSIDDDPTLLTADPEFAAPKRDLMGISKQAGPAYLSRQSRAALTSCQNANVTYRRISPEPHAGAHATTGWQLSATVRSDDLGDALKTGNDAGKALDEIRGMLDTKPDCGGPPA